MWFGHDFSTVRIHADARAAAAAASLDAEAFSTGQHVFFASGRYQPDTTAGRRLLAHELTHVVQRSRPAIAQKAVSSPFDASEEEASHIAEGVDAPSAGGPVVQAASSADIHRQPAPGGAPQGGAPDVVPAEKSSAGLEGLYRARGDLRRAAAIRECRVQGGSACGIVLTQREVAALHALAQKSRGDEQEVRKNLTDAAPSLALLGPVGSFTGTGAATGAGAAASGSTAAGATATGAGMSAGAVTATGVGAVIVVCVLAGYTLWQLGRFQQELTARGFIIMDDPLAVCISGCHHGGPARVPDFRRLEADPFPDVDMTALRRFAERPPARRGDTDVQPRPQPMPRPRPADPDVDEDERHGCRGFATFQRGGNTCHDRFATSVSGVPREWMVVTPAGDSDSFDARGQDRQTLYEMKTGYGWLVNQRLSPKQQAWRESTIERWTRQSAHQQAVADRCGYRLVWVFTDENARRFADGIVQAPTRTIRFNCNEDGERGR